MLYVQEFLSVLISTTVYEYVRVLCFTQSHLQSLGVRECVSGGLLGRAITVMDGPCVEAVIICYVSGCV